MVERIVKKPKVIGLEKKEVKILPYNPVWKKLYKKEADAIHSIKR